MAKYLIIGLAALLLAMGAEIQRPPIQQYIRDTWRTLTRTNHTLAEAAMDPKFPPASNRKRPVYIPVHEDSARIQQQLRLQMSDADFRKLDLLPLPADIAHVTEQGLLYLPQPYVVPGGRFNEMYGWDSYFIQLGLLRDGLLPEARGMAENFLYEIRSYGMILNANRTYYLTRSQPPFLTEMLLNVYRQTHDRRWLQEAMPEIEKYYRYWTTAPHLTPETGLSRYFDSGRGPAPEVVASERDAQGHTHYDLVRQYFRMHKVTDYDAGQYYDARQDRLTPLFYTGDRSMRESGFDPSDRFGPFSVDIIHYNPVCLNALLYQMEMQTAEILRVIDRQGEAAAWEGRARDRAAKVNRLMWDERTGLYYDYDFVHRRVRQYPFLTTFYPLWAGMASKDQAARVVANVKRFERAGGLMTSTIESGNQWDAPFGWAPLELLAVKGLRRYGYTGEADRISKEFLSLILEQYRLHGTLVEKYDVVRRSMDLKGEIHFGYRSNEAGFGWTNAVFTALWDGLPERDRTALARGSEPAVR